ncbi:conserved hypothetical protein [Xanthomonas phaseoli pv. phaseoli]|uniref:Secreted protein n=1 Tax=Xanthomonas campestris pv. phaseoli TaxID=317013 RepID=A0AB38DV15_XANCH|nr:conserved hypothetical protein [Xanthomonas phaseoli pv. phaseoli]
MVCPSRLEQTKCLLSIRLVLMLVLMPSLRVFRSMFTRAKLSCLVRWTNKPGAWSARRNGRLLADAVDCPGRILSNCSVPRSTSASLNYRSINAYRLSQSRLTLVMRLLRCEIKKMPLILRTGVAVTASHWVAALADVVHESGFALSKHAIKVFLMIGHLSCLNSLALGTPHTFPCLLSDPSKVFIGVKHQMEDCE